MHDIEDLYQRVLKRTVKSVVTGCEVWQGAKTPKGYGHANAGGRTLYVHRIAYEANNGPIQPGLVIDHTCCNKLCCNPKHLEAVTNAENLRRARKAHCIRGHEQTPENVVVSRSGHRKCRICHAMRSRNQGATA